MSVHQLCKVVLVGLWIVSCLDGKPLSDKFRREAIHYIPLISTANMKLADTLSLDAEESSLADLPRGEQVFANQIFNIEDGLIQLSGSKTKNKPMAALGIKVGRRFAKLNILHGTRSGEAPGNNPELVPDGTTIAYYTIHYSDNTTAKVRIVYGRDVRDSSYRDKSDVPLRGVVAWPGSNRAANPPRQKARLYMTTWENPQPRKLVTRVDYRSTDTACAPFCVAMTSEGDGLKAPSTERFYDFRIGNFAERDFKFFGPDAANRIKREMPGLRITLPAQQVSPDQVGVATQFDIQGDVEITVGYEILEARQPKEGWGVGLEVYLVTDTLKREALAFYRKISPNGSDVFRADRITTNAQGKRERMFGNGLDDIPANGPKSGQLRITRVGSTAVLAATIDAGPKFQNLYRVDLGPDLITTLNLSAYPGFSANVVDLRLRDLRIRTLSSN